MSRNSSAGPFVSLGGRLLAAALAAFGSLPLPWVSALGGLAGRLTYRLNGRGVANARVNLRLCFPELAEAEREALVRENLLQTGRSLAQMASIWGGRRRDWASLVEPGDFLILGRRLMERGKGLIISLPHLGNWEPIAYVVTELGSTTALYRPPRMAALDPLMRQGRARSGIAPVPTDRQGLKCLHAALQAGDLVAILPDQVPKTAGASGVEAPFFGRPAMTMTLISRLARRHGSPVLFCYSVYDEDLGKFRLHAFEGDTQIANVEPVLAATALNRDVERCVRAFPAQYQWTYRRFQVPGARRSGPY